MATRFDIGGLGMKSYACGALEQAVWVRRDVQHMVKGI